MTTTDRSHDARTIAAETIELVERDGIAYDRRVRVVPVLDGVFRISQETPGAPARSVALSVDDETVLVQVLDRAGCVERTAHFREMPAGVIAPVVSAYLM